MIKLLLPSLFSCSTAGTPIHAIAEYSSPTPLPWPKLRIKIGRNTQPITLSTFSGPQGDSSLHFEFQTGRGLKLVKLQFQTDDGNWKTASRCIIWAKAKVLTPPAPPLRVTSAEPATKPILLPPASSQPKVSIIIPVYNQWAFTCACLQSILSSEPALDYEIILADDQSTDDTRQAATFVPGIIISKPATNQGFVRNCNQAARLARGKYLYFLNNDTQLQPGAITALLSVFADRPDAGIVGSKLIYPDGRLQEAGGIIWKDASGWNYGHGQDRSLPEFNYIKETDYVSGASLMISRELWLNLGGFSEEFAPAYCEDSDLAFKTRAAGLKVYYQPASTLIHFEGVSNGRDLSTGLKAYQVVNNRKFYEKWRDTLDRENFPNAQNLFWARDRSRDKKLILFIDHYIPKPDQDAGSRTIYHFIRILATLRYNIKFIGDNFYYDQHYKHLLENLGVEILAGRHYRDHWKEWIASHADKLHAVFLSRPHITERYIDYVAATCPRARLVYYGHDLHHVRAQREFELTQNPDCAAQAASWRAREHAIFSKIHCSLSPSHTETGYVSSLYPKLQCLTTPIFYWDHIDDGPLDLTQRRDYIFVGGFGHPPNLDGLLCFLDHTWPLILADLPDSRLNIVGSNPPALLKERRDPGIILHGFVGDEVLATLYATTLAAIVPLRYGAGVKGKTVEAMKHGLPIISTSVGIEGLENLPAEIVAYDDPITFARQAVRLKTEAHLWQTQSNAQLRYVKTTFSRARALRDLSLAIEGTTS
jgi:GT2 family glycosyltransferase